MSIVADLTKRFLITALFMAALLTTFQSLSGVKIIDLSKWVIEKSQHMLTEANSNTEYLSLQTKDLSHVQLKDSFVAGANPISLEEAMNFHEFPSVAVTATGYTAGIESTGKTPSHPQYGITYSGVKVKRDLYSTIAADPRVFPIGTILFIPGYGYGVVADTGSAIKGNKIDLYYDTVDQVYKHWGKKTLDVYIIETGNGSLTEQELKDLNEDEALQVFRQQYLQG